MFIGEKSETTDTAELSLCLEESFANLELMGVDCAIDIPSSNTIFTKDAIRVYDFFETVTEAAMYNLHSVWLKGRSFSDYVSFHLEVECDSQLSDFYQLAENGYFEDGVWRWCIYRSNIFRCYRALRKEFKAKGADKTADMCADTQSNVLIMEVAAYTPWKIEERMKIRDEVKAYCPDCKIVLVVDENTEKKLADKVRRAKKDRLIDNFLYGSVSATYLSAVVDTL